MTTAEVASLRAARPEALTAVAARLSAHAARLGEFAAAAGRFTPTATDWTGPAREAAAGRHTEIAALARTLAEGLARCAEAIRAAGHETADAQRCLAHAERLAGVADATEAAGPGATPLADEARRAAERACADYAATLVRLRSRLAASADRYAVSPRTVARAATTWASSVGAATDWAATDWATLATVIAPPTGPADASAWFAALTEAEREWVIAAHPEWVGPRDGIPAWARDRANRALLDVFAEQLAAQARALRDAPIDLADSAILALTLSTRRRQLAEIVAELDGLRAVKELLATPDGRQRQLLSLGTDGCVLTAAVTSGDLDAAGHVAVFVPGFQADVAGDIAKYARQIEAAADLADRLSRTHGDARPVVGITWLGYAAPAVRDVLIPGRSVAGWGPALAGAPRLGRLLAGLDAAGRAAHPADPARLVLWGHSYGSVVTGLALRDAQVPIAGAVVFGSPGIAVDRVSELHLPAGQLYVHEALDDVVAATSRFAADPGLLREATQLSVAGQVLPDGSSGTTSYGHEEYLTPGSTSQWNLAAVAAGTTQLVVTRPACPPWSPMSGRPMPVCERPLRIG